MIQGIAAVGQFIALLVQLLPDAIKAWQAWEKHNGEKLSTRKRRREVVEKLREGVKMAAETKDTSALENLFKPNGDVSPAVTVEPTIEEPKA